MRHTQSGILCSLYKEWTRAWTKVLDASNRHTNSGSLGRKGFIGRILGRPFHNASGGTIHTVPCIYLPPTKTFEIVQLGSLARISGGSLKWQPETKKVSQGISVVVQWLRSCAPNARSPDSIPHQRTKIPHAETKTQHSQINQSMKIFLKISARFTSKNHLVRVPPADSQYCHCTVTNDFPTVPEPLSYLLKIHSPRRKYRIY